MISIYMYTYRRACMHTDNLHAQSGRQQESNTIFDSNFKKIHVRVCTQRTFILRADADLSAILIKCWAASSLTFFISSSNERRSWVRSFSMSSICSMRVYVSICVYIPIYASMYIWICIGYLHIYIYIYIYMCFSLNPSLG